MQITQCVSTQTALLITPKKKKSRGEAQSTQCCDATILKCLRYEKEKRLSHAA